MTQTPKYILQAFGAVLFLALLGCIIYSLTQSPVTDGPMPPIPPMSTSNPMSN